MSTKRNQSEVVSEGEADPPTRAPSSRKRRLTAKAALLQSKEPGASPRSQSPIRKESPPGIDSPHPPDTTQPLPPPNTTQPPDFDQNDGSWALELLEKSYMKVKKLEQDAQTYKNEIETYRTDIASYQSATKRLEADVTKFRSYAKTREKCVKFLTSALEEESTKNSKLESSINALKQQAQAIINVLRCPVCYELKEELSMSQCGHMVCDACRYRLISDHVEEYTSAYTIESILRAVRCPECRSEIGVSSTTITKQMPGGRMIIGLMPLARRLADVLDQEQ